jgi:hypothetical protein
VPVSGVALPQRDSYEQALSEIRQQVGDVQTWLDSWAVPLEQLNAEVADTDSFAPATLSSLRSHSFLIGQSALIGAVATKNGNTDQALAAWRLNRALLKLADGDVELATLSLTARINSWAMWNLLSNDELALLASETDLRQLVPDVTNKMTWENELRRRWTVRKLALREAGWPHNFTATGVASGRAVYPPAKYRPALRSFPPLRWAVERVMAIHLDEELGIIQGTKGTTKVTPDLGTASHDRLVYQLELLLHLEHNVTARIAQHTAP